MKRGINRSNAARGGLSLRVRSQDATLSTLFFAARRPPFAMVASASKNYRLRGAGVTDGQLLMLSCAGLDAELVSIKN